MTKLCHNCRDPSFNKKNYIYFNKGAFMVHCLLGIQLSKTVPMYSHPNFTCASYILYLWILPSHAELLLLLLGFRLTPGNLLPLEEWIFQKESHWRTISKKGCWGKLWVVSVICTLSQTFKSIFIFSWVWFSPSEAVMHFLVVHFTLIISCSTCKMCLFYQGIKYTPKHLGDGWYDA